jgi:type IV secretory pathway component VirB8
MDAVRESIRDAIKQGSYFEDARKWYMYTYLTPLTERAWLLISCGILLLLAVFTFLTLFFLFPVNKRFVFLVEIPNTLEEYATIRPLSKGQSRQQEAIEDMWRYLLSQYVLMRESYPLQGNHPSLLERQRLFISNNSSREVFEQFQRYMGLQNPTSPLLRYQSNTVRRITIQRITFSSPKENEQTAKISFTASVKQGNQEKISTWYADIRFTYINPLTLVQKRSTLDFRVIDYTTVLIKGDA